MTASSFQGMLNPYQALQVQKESSKELVSERERIRNQFIDRVGRNPTEQELDALLVQSKVG